MSQHNVFQVSDWNGTSGERWVANQIRLDRMLAAFGDAAIAAADPREGEDVLDIGCGAGASSIALASRAGARGQVLGLDISAPLIARARETAIHPALAFEVADAATAVLSPPRTFDLLFSRFGVMFFDAPAAAFAHMRAMLKPGGRLAFVCWRGAAENDWVRLPMGAIHGLVPPQGVPDPEAPGPFSFGDRDRIARILAAAGFRAISIEPFDRSIPFGEGNTREAALDDAVAMAFAVGPLSRALADQPEDVRAHAAAAVRTAFATKPGERSVLIDGAAWIVTAQG